MKTITQSICPDSQELTKERLTFEGCYLLADSQYVDGFSLWRLLWQMTMTFFVLVLNIASNLSDGNVFARKGPMI